MRRIQTLFIEAVADLVHGAEEGVAEAMGMVAGGDAAIAGADAAARRMRRHIQPAALEIKADGTGHHLPEGPLPIDRKVAAQHFLPGPPRPRGGFRQQGGQRRAQQREQPGEVGAAQAWLLLFQ